MRGGDGGTEADGLRGVLVGRGGGEVCSVDLCQGVSASEGDFVGIGIPNPEHCILNTLCCDETMSGEVVDKSCVCAAGGEPGHLIWIGSLLWNGLGLADRVVVKQDSSECDK